MHNTYRQHEEDAVQKHHNERGALEVAVLDDVVDLAAKWMLCAQNRIART